MADLHPSNRRWMVHFRDRDGKVRQSHNATAWVGEKDQYPERIAVLRTQVPDGWSLDTTDADEAHSRLCAAKERYAAQNEWWMGDTLGRRHPGSLSEYMD